MVDRLFILGRVLAWMGKEGQSAARQGSFLLIFKQNIPLSEITTPNLNRGVFL